MSTRRNRIPSNVEQEVLLKSKRRCAICFGVFEDDTPKLGQIVHLDRDSGNAAEDNLVFLCLNHHAAYDFVTSKPKNLTIGEVKTARQKLYDAVDQEETSRVVYAGDARAFEEKVADYVRNQFSARLGEFFSLHRNFIFDGRSGVSYEVDIATRFRMGDLEFFTIFEVKSRQSPATPSDLLEFIARAKDLGADKAVYVSAGGFSAGALHLARAQGISLIQANRETGVLHLADSDESATFHKTRKSKSKSARKTT